MECEACEKNQSEVDALVEGQYKRLCKACAQLEGAVVVERPARNNVMDSYKRATVKEVLMRMSGMQNRGPVVQQAESPRYSPIKTNRVTLGGKKEEEIYPSNSSGSEIVSNFPRREVRIVQTREAAEVQAPEAEPKAEDVKPKRGFFSRLFGGKEDSPEVPSPTSGPSLPPMGGLNEDKRKANADDGVLEM